MREGEKERRRVGGEDCAPAHTGTIHASVYMTV